MKITPLSLAISVILPNLAAAQKVENTNSSSVNTIELAPITVNARFISESSFDLPFTTNRISEQTLEQHTDHSLESLMQQTAGVEIHSFGNPQSTVKIRGVGLLSNESGSSDDTAVVIYQNGAPQANNRLSLPIFDMQQVEILKGPQGTLYGRNSSAGVINLMPNLPSAQQEGSIDVKLGTQHFQQAELMFNQPINEQLNARFSAHYQKQAHALDNTQNGGKPLGYPNSRGARLGLSYQPTAQDELLFTAEYNKQAQQFAAITLLDGSTSTDIDDSKLLGDQENSSATLNWTHQWDNFQFSSITNVLKNNYTTGGPAYDDRVFQVVMGQTFDTNRQMGSTQRNVFQEFRLGSLESAPIFWTIGANYLHSNRDFFFDFVEDETGGQIGGAMYARIDRKYKTRSTGIFGEITYPLTDRFSITGGLRFNWDKLNYSARWEGKTPGSGINTDAQSLTDRYITGRLGLTFDINEQSKVYSMYAHGHKTGSFGEFSTNIASGIQDTPYQAAKTNSYEIGTKWQSEDNRLEASASVFYNKTRNEHLYVLIDPMTSWANTTENFDTTSKGAELEASWQINEHFKLGGNIAYTDAKISKVPANTLSAAKAGNRIPDTPRWSASLSADYTTPIYLFNQDADFNAHIDYHFTGKRTEDVDNNFLLKSAHILNTRFGISTNNSEIYIWGKNLLNNRSPIYGYQFAPDVRFGSIREGRAVGVGYRYRF